MRGWILGLLLLTACGTKEEYKLQEQIFSTQDSSIINFHEVEPGLYRSGELTAKNVIDLKNKYGIKTIVSIDSYTLNKDAMRFEINAAVLSGINWVWHPMNPIGDLDIKKTLQAETALETLERPLLFHCHRGSERTGIVAAAYRVKHGWSFKDAYAEADLYGFSSWYNEWKRDLQRALTHGLAIPQD